MRFPSTIDPLRTPGVLAASSARGPSALFFSTLAYTPSLDTYKPFAHKTSGNSRRGGLGISDRGVSGYLSVQYSNRRTEIHEETKT